MPFRFSGKSGQPGVRVSSRRRKAHTPCCRLRVERLEDRTLLSYSSLVYPGADGNLIYAPDGYGNRIEDFSDVGYLGGAVPLPDTPGGVGVPVVVTLGPTGGDQGARIQAAIDQVSQLPLDANGFRGAVLLRSGEYAISDHIQINASGVVLEGEGTSATAGTRLRATGTSQRTLVQVFGSGSRSTVAGTTHNLTDTYVPVGARSFHVDSTANLHVGDTIIVHRPSPANWIHDIGMDRLQNPWQPNSKNLDFDRVITDIGGNQITVDAPLTNSFDQQYGGGTIHRYTWSGRLENVGIENLYGKSDYSGSTDENHSWRFITLDKVENAWVNNVVSQYFAFGCVETFSGAKWVTVQNSQCLDPISQITGERRYSFDINDGSQLNLFQGDYTRKGRHDFTIQSLAPGPNVFVDCSSDNAYNETGPHQRWSTGVLFDNVVTHGDSASGLNIRNAGNEGTGHGWQGANDVVWNSTADRMNLSSPPTAQNWAVGDVAGSYGGNAIWVSRGQHVQPESLYYSQRGEALAYPGLQRREYWLGNIDNFTGAENFPYVDPDWYAAVAGALGDGQTIMGFDATTRSAWVPFTFPFALDPSQQVVGATLSLGLRRTGGSSTANDIQIHVGSLDNSFTFGDLGWLPLGFSGTKGVVMDLSGQLDRLQNGMLNVAVEPNAGVCWAVLDLQVAPIPSGQVVDLGPVADAFVRAGQYAGQNYGGASTLTVKNASADLTREAFLRFDLSGITGTVVNAVVRLVPTNVHENVEHGIAFVPDNSWDESGITWGNRPGSAGILFQRTVVAAYQSVSYNVTPFVQSALAGDNLLSLRVWSVMNIGDGYVDYGSREGNPAYSPVLEITLGDGSSPGNAGGPRFTLAAKNDLGQGAEGIPDATPRLAWDEESAYPDAATASATVPVTPAPAAEQVVSIALPEPDGGLGIVPALPDPVNSPLGLPV